MKKTFTLLLATLLSLTAATAEAGSFSRGGASFSRGSTVSSPARSVGMTRPSVAPSYTPPRPPTPPAPPRPSTSPSYAPPPTVSRNTTTIVNQGGSGGSGFLSSAAGGFTGSVLGNLVSQPHGVPVAGAGYVPTGAAPAAPAGAYPAAGSGGVVEGVAVVPPAQVYVAPSSQGSVGAGIAKFLWWMLVSVVLLALIGSILFFLYRTVQNYRREQEAEVDPGPIPFNPVEKFILIQKMFATRNADALRRLLTADLAEQKIDDLPPEDSEYTLSHISWYQLDWDGKVASIHFKAMDTSDGSTLSEIWHFRQGHFTWQLAGVEPVL